MMFMVLIADAWWSPEVAGWMGGIGGSFLGLLGGVLGGLAGVLAPRGQGRRLVLGLMSAIVVVAAAVLLVGIVAVILGQPYAVWYPCLLFGVIGTGVFGVLIPVIRKRYRHAEQRLLEAQSLREV